MPPAFLGPASPVVGRSLVSDLAGSVIVGGVGCLCCSTGCNSSAVWCHVTVLCCKSRCLRCLYSEPPIIIITVIIYLGCKSNCVRCLDLPPLFLDSNLDGDFNQMRMQLVASMVSELGLLLPGHMFAGAGNLNNHVVMICNPLQLSGCVCC
jgi:hypothetical protein